jgi:hypothetical protein
MCILCGKLVLKVEMSTIGDISNLQVCDVYIKMLWLLYLQCSMIWQADWWEKELRGLLQLAMPFETWRRRYCGPAAW